MTVPSFDQFTALSKRANLVPVYREVLADLETPVSAFLKIADTRSSFLLESIEGGEKWARYSFLGTGPATLFRSRDRYYEIVEDEHVLACGESDDPLSVLQTLMQDYQPATVPGLPLFSGGGAVGYLGYDMVRFVEELPQNLQRTIGCWDSCFMLTRSVLIFDNVRQTIKVVNNVRIVEGEKLETAYSRGCDEVETLIAQLRSPLSEEKLRSPQTKPTSLEGNFSPDDFRAAVEACKEYIRAGDIFQVVLSQRFSGPLAARPFDVYRALRTINPSPYMFFLQFDETSVIGASPEVLVRLEDGQIDVRPIAGTRHRGATDEEDIALEKELLADPKERAEHIMLVDLGRNDVGRVAKAGTVDVSEMMVVERYSHVMHIVSNVRGQVPRDRDAFDVFRACFPAGTLSGSPKIRAMEIIEELEPDRREIYGGAVGYFSYSGNMDLAIAIRTLVVHDGKLHLQAGAGIVADSDPECEYQETLNKARGVQKAIEMASAGLD